MRPHPNDRAIQFQPAAGQTEASGNFRLGQMLRLQLPDQFPRFHGGHRGAEGRMAFGVLEAEVSPIACFGGTARLAMAPAFIGASFTMPTLHVNGLIGVAAVRLAAVSHSRLRGRSLEGQNLL